MSTRKCTRCGKVKNEGEFYKRKDGKPRSWCKDCNREAADDWFKTHPGEAARRAREWRKKNPERVREGRRKGYQRARLKEIERRYGLTEEGYNDYLRRQKNACAICRRDFSTFKRGPHVDHNHETGAVRGLLCRRCNSLLGFVEDEAKILSSAARYLRKCHGI